VLVTHQVKPIKKFRRKVDFIRYERPLPGDRIQMDTCKLGPGLYQYTLQRLFRNSHMTGAHAYTDYDVCSQILGRALMGLEPDPGLF